MIYFIIAGVFVVISLKPLKEAAAYRFSNGKWVAVGLGLILCAVWIILSRDFWGIIVASILSYLALTMKYDD